MARLWLTELRPSSMASQFTESPEVIGFLSLSNSWAYSVGFLDKLGSEAYLLNGADFIMF